MGKTHLAIGIGQEPIKAGYKVLFTILILVEKLELAEIKGELKNQTATLAASSTIYTSLCWEGKAID